MVNSRQAMNYYGLEIQILAVNDKPFHFAGEDPQFKLVARNVLDNQREGLLIVKWELGLRVRFLRLPFSIPAKGVGEYEIERDWLYAPGTAIYSLVLFEWSPEGFYLDNGMTRSLDQTNLLMLPFHVMCSFEVKDKATYEAEEAKHRELVDKLDNMPKVVLKETSARIAAAVQDPRFIAEVAKEKRRQEQEEAQKQYEEARRKEQAQKNPLST